MKCRDCICNGICCKWEDKQKGGCIKQEPCEDAVSRKFMYELGATCIAARNKNGKLIALGAIENLPPVNPQQKDRVLDTSQRKTV